MEAITTFFLVFIVLIILAQTLITSRKEHVLIILIVMTVVVMYAYQQYKQVDTFQHSTNAMVAKLASLAKVRQEDDADVSMTDRPAVKLIMASDNNLQDVLGKLTQFQDIDPHMYDDVVLNLFKFYDLYAACLAGTKSAFVAMPIMLDQRRNILNRIASLYAQLDHKKYGARIYSIILGLQASTYKCMNVLKNKYGAHDYLSPIAHNIMDDVHLLF